MKPFPPHNPEPDDAWSAFVLGAVLIVLAVVLSLSTGCGSAWPEVCDVSARAGVTCDVRDVELRVVPHPSKPRPAGAFEVWTEYGRLPLLLTGDAIALPCEVTPTPATRVPL